MPALLGRCSGGTNCEANASGQFPRCLGEPLFHVIATERE
jgi:hypothetical protein